MCLFRPSGFPDNEITMLFRACKTWAISLQLIQADCCTSSLWDCDFSHDWGGMGELKRDLGVCELPSQYVQRWSWNNKHTDMIWPKFLAFMLHKVDWMQGSGFHQQQQLGTFHTDESPSHTAAIVSLLTARVLLGKQSQAGRRWWCDTLRLS